MNQDANSTHSSTDDKKEVIELKYYDMQPVEKEKIIKGMEATVAYLKEINIGSCKTPQEFVEKTYNNDAVRDMFIYFSQLPAFSKEFALSLSHNLDLLAVAKKLKYYTNNTLGQNAILLKNLAETMSSPIEGMQEQVDLLFEEKKFADLRVKDYMPSQTWDNAKKYLANDEALVKIDPHSVYPTSIYRTCNGVTLATKDSQTIEAVMSTDVTTTIKITRGILEHKNRILAEIYKPLGRCIALVDDKVEQYFGEELQKYFDAHKIPLTKLVHPGNEANKDMKNVENILLDMKQNGVSRNEPILIVGGGVIADIGGFATALYHRNTPYVMLCTSIVTGIDAGPSPRTCCDGYGFKNLYGAYHPPIYTITDRYFWKTMHEGWIRHGIAEIIKMATVEDLPLFELLEKAGERLVRTKFGTSEDCQDDKEFQDLCDAIVGKGMESYVKDEYGNLWETHQARPHAFGHTWSPGYELPAGMLHGHAVSTCMGYGAFLAWKRNWISVEHFKRIMNVMSVMELAVWHPIMDNHDLVISANKKAYQKRGGNLCAPVPKDEIGQCGYINDLKNEDIPPSMNEYKAWVQANMPRGGRGVDEHCHEVGLEDPSITAQDAYKEDKDVGTNNTSNSTQPREAESAAIELKEPPTTYEEWIVAEQTKRNDTFWEANVISEVAPDTVRPMKFDKFTLFQEGAESYALAHTTVASDNVQVANTITEKKKMFLPCMVGAMESQFLKMQCMVKGAKRCLDIGTFTGMSAIAMAEGIPEDGEVVTMECYQNVADVAQEIFDATSVAKKIKLMVGQANEFMKTMVAEGQKFDIIFIDADKENYIEYYELGLQLLEKDGIILADNSLCALLYDQDQDMRSKRLHDFNQHVKNDKRVEQVVLTLREGVTLIKPVQ